MLFVFIVDLEADLNGLRKWLHEVENQVLPLHVKSNWTVDELEQKLKEHQVSFYISLIKNARPPRKKYIKSCEIKSTTAWKKVTAKRQQVFTSSFH